MKDLFVSYTTADEAWAQWIAWQLESAGYSTTIQAWDFRPGSNFVLEMQRALKECERVIAVLSPRYFASRFAAEEWSAAIASDPTGDRLLPIRIEPCENEGLFRARIYIDLVGADEATAKQRLLDGVKRGRAKPATAPPFPSQLGESVIRPYRFPGALPPIWNIPFQRNPHFTGRDDLFAQLRAALLGDHAGRPYGAIALTQPQTLHGLGGVGKTQLAVEYAYRYASEYDIVWWIRAESPMLIATDLALLAAPLQLPERDERDQNIVVQAVLRALAQRERWLLIFDNAEDARDVRAFLPQERGAIELRHNILITSRNPNWGALARPLDVQVLPRDEAITFLLRRIGVITHPTQPSPISNLQSLTSDAGELADALGCLPLALEQAGAYIETHGITIADYLRLYRTHRQKLLAYPPATDYPAAVATTWDISFQAVEKQNPASAQLLKLLAFFAPDPLPRAILQTQRVSETFRVSLEDDYEFNAVIAPLRRYSLVQTGEGTLTMHR
ncbi:MAG: FxSxx-COOH system tetratricopeptide repeat protein, partial [Anaerolineae bacterium]|nr:FxSxx-COOH system tetratricopeptide repeat protein [Anaerolineae bacterium]